MREGPKSCGPTSQTIGVDIAAREKRSNVPGESTKGRTIRKRHASRENIHKNRIRMRIDLNHKRVLQVGGLWGWV